MLCLLCLFYRYSFAGNGVIKGVVYNQKTFEVLEDVSIYLYGKNGNYYNVEWSNNEGVFTLENIDSGWYELVVAGDNYQRRYFDSIRVDSNEIVLFYPSIKYVYGYYQNNFTRSNFVSQDFDYTNYFNQYSALNGLKIYPNPVQEYLNIIRTSNAPIEVKIIDGNGNQFVAFKMTVQTQMISLQHLPKGMYTIIFNSAEDQKDFRFLKL
jgi:hypothetical protein